MRTLGDVVLRADEAFWHKMALFGTPGKDCFGPRTRGSSRNERGHYFWRGDGPPQPAELQAARTGDLARPAGRRGGAQYRCCVRAARPEFGVGIAVDR